VAELIFNRHNLNISFTSSTEDFSEFQTYLNILIDDLWDKRITKPDYNFKLDGKCEGLLLPSKVQYIAKAYNFRRMGYKYTGKIAVLSRILRLGYLFEQVRVMGGAYGARSGFDRNGNFFFGSYRDPNLIDTMESFNKAGSFIREFKVSDREMSKYIIGAFSELDHPLTPSMKGEKAMSNYISHITQEDIQKERDEVLDTKPQDIREYADLITEAMKQDYYCVVGSEGKIKENKGLFGKLISVFE